MNEDTTQSALDPIRVVVVDDHEVVRAGLSAALALDPNITVVGDAGHAAEALALVTAVQPDLVVLDYRLPDTTGAELCADIRRLPNPPLVVMLSTYLSETIVQASMDAGAEAYVTKAAGVAEIRREIVRVGRQLAAPGESAMRTVNRLTRLVGDRHSAAGATPQQIAVLRLAAEGLTDRQIATRLFISESTVRFHIQNLKRRFDARNKVELVARAIEDGVLPPFEGAARVIRAK